MNKTTPQLSEFHELARQLMPHQVHKILFLLLPMSVFASLPQDNACNEGLPPEDQEENPKYSASI